MDRETVEAGLDDGLAAIEKASFQSRSEQLTPDIPLEMEVRLRIEKVTPIPNILPHSDASGDNYYLGDMYSGISRELWEISTNERPYLRYLKSISDGWPHIRWLADFMEVGTSPMKWKFLSKEDTESRARRTRVAVLEFSPNHPPTRKDIQSSEKLTQLLESSSDPGPDHARLFVVEDLSRDVIEALGAKFDIDPLFFRNQISDYLWYNTRDPWVELSDLDHVTSERNFWTLRYMRPRYFRSEKSINDGLKELGGFNVLRRLEQDISFGVRKLRRVKDATVGIIRSKVSLWIRENKVDETGAVGILVLDPTIAEGFPLWGGARNLAPCPSMHTTPLPPSPPRTSLFEDVIHYTLTLPTSTFISFPIHPNLFAVPILSLIATEWLTVMGYITTGLTKIEWELEHPTYRDASFGLDGALDRLHPLRRTMPVYRNMILEVLTTILSSVPRSPSLPISPNPTRRLDQLRSDFQSLLTSIDRLQTRMQNIISLATTIISIEENKRAMKMNKNLVRVTYLAVVFVPMAFVSSFFSMTPNLGDLTQTFWVYFAIAVPLTGLCLAVADQGRGLVQGWKWAKGWVWARKRRVGVESRTD